MNRFKLAIMPARMLTGILLTTIAALSVHTIMLQELKVPFPDLSLVPLSLKILNRVVQAYAVVMLCRLAFLRQSKATFFWRWGTITVVVGMLNETLFRAPFMDGYCGNAILSAFVANLSKALATAALCGFAVTAAPRLNKPWQVLLGSSGIAVVVLLIVSPLLGVATAPLVKAVSGLASSGTWCTLPYGPKILIPAYLTFLEPVLGCMGAAALMWKKLSLSTGKRFLFFAIIILALKNQLLAPFLYAAVAKLPLGLALASDGQFALEALALALLTGVTWTFSVEAACASRSSSTLAGPIAG